MLLLGTYLLSKYITGFFPVTVRNLPAIQIIPYILR